MNRLKRVTRLLYHGDRIHRSMKLVYIIVGLLSTIAIIVVVELILWNRRVRKLKGTELSKK